MNTYRVHTYNPATCKVSTTQVDSVSSTAATDMVMKTHIPGYKLLKVEFLNEYKNWEPVIQVAITPVVGRIETGPLKINDDWCGYFIRGDNACGFSIDAVEIEEWFNSLPEEHRKKIWIQMSSLLSQLKGMSACRNK